MRLNARSKLGSFLFICSAASAGAQRPTVPGPEVKQLAYFVGSWKSSGTMQLGSMNGPFGATDQQALMDGGFFLENHSEFSTPFGPGKLLEIVGFDPQRKVYIHESFSSAGQHIASTGTYADSTYTFMSADGRSRHTIRIESPTAFRFKTETSTDGATWSTLVSGSSTKQMP